MPIRRVRPSSGYGAGPTKPARHRIIAMACRASAKWLRPRRRTHSLCGSDHLVCEQRQTITDGLGADETQRRLVTGLAEEALACSEHDWEDDKPKLVNKAILYQCADELVARIDEN